MIKYLTNAPRWLFLAALVFAPWAYGCTRPYTITELDAILGVVLVLWAAGCIGRRRWPVIPRPLWIGALLLVAQGWFLIFNAQGRYDRYQLIFYPLKQWFPWAPGVVDRVDCVPAMINDTVMLGALCFAADLARRPEWRTRIWWTAALNGLALMICGLTMKVLGIAISSYLIPGEIGWDSFAFYFYHGNAGAYINLILPLVGGLATLAFTQSDAAAQRALWVPGLLICVASSVVALSKGGMAISLCLLVALAVWFARSSVGRARISLSRAHWMILIAAVLAVLLAMGSLGWSGAAGRWATLASSNGKEESLLSRILVAEACFRMMKDSGIWGFGAGNFMICFPHYANDLGPAVAGIWFFAHDDYLQALVEWGYLGAALLGFVFFGGIWMGFRRVLGKPMPEADSVLLSVVLMALVGVAVHAAFDFPLQIASLQLYAAAYLGLCWASGGIEPPEAQVRRRRG